MNQFHHLTLYLKEDYFINELSDAQSGQEGIYEIDRTGQKTIELIAASFLSDRISFVTAFFSNVREKSLKDFDIKDIPNETILYQLLFILVSRKVYVSYPVYHYEDQ